MSKGQHFQPVQFALLVHDATGEVCSGTISQRDLDGTRRLAESIPRVMPEATTVWVHPWMGTTYAASCVEVVRRPASSGPVIASDPVTVPIIHDLPVEPVPASNGVEVSSEDVSVELSVEPEPTTEPVMEPVPMKRRGRPSKVKQEVQA